MSQLDIDPKAMDHAVRDVMRSRYAENPRGLLTLLGFGWLWGDGDPVPAPEPPPVPAPCGARGFALSVGLNVVSAAGYGGWDGKLNGCVNDAKAMRQVLARRGFETTLLLDEQATVSAARSWLRDAALKARAGDFVVMTSSRHGGRVPDYDHDETGDKQDDTLCLFDRQWLDDEYRVEIAGFREGVRFLDISDACHSGTVTRGMGPDRPSANQWTARSMPQAVIEAAYAAQESAYRRARGALRNATQSAPRCHVLGLSACLEQEVAYDGQKYGAFTAAFLDVLGGIDGDFAGDYRQFSARIARAVKTDQTPSHDPFTNGAAFARQRILDIGAGVPA